MQMSGGHLLPLVQKLVATIRFRKAETAIESGCRHQTNIIRTKFSQWEAGSDLLFFRDYWDTVLEKKVLACAFDIELLTWKSSMKLPLWQDDLLRNHEKYHFLSLKAKTRTLLGSCFWID